MCIESYRVTMGASVIAPESAAAQAVRAEAATLTSEIVTLEKINNGSYGELVVKLCGYSGEIKPLLDQDIRVTNGAGEVCYCGYVEEAYRCCGVYTGWGWSNATLFNRIGVSSTENGVVALSNWHEESLSIATHGTRELVVALPAGSLWTADQYAQRLLYELGQPRPILHNTYRCDCPNTFLVVRGYYETLAWQTYTNACGLAESHADFGANLRMGYGFRSDLVGINGGAIGVIGEQLGAFAVGDVIQITGSSVAGNNISMTVSEVIQPTFHSVTSNGLSFTSNRILDSNSSLKLYQENQLIQVVDTNTFDVDGYYWIRDELDGPEISVQHQTFSPPVSFSGQDVTIVGSTTIEIDGVLTNEEPGTVITVALFDQWVCQPVCNDDCGEAWTVTHVAVGLRKVGNPTDALQVDLATGCGAADVLFSTTISAAAVSAGYQYVLVPLPGSVAIAAGQWLYVRLHRLGDVSITDYYQVAVSNTGASKLSARTGPDGVNWALSANTATVRLLEYKNITEQLFDLIGLGNFVDGVVVLEALATVAPTYRSGYSSLLYAIEQLLTMGDVAGGRLKIRFSCERLAVIRLEPLRPDLVDPHDLAAEPFDRLSCACCPDGEMCTMEAGRWLVPEAGVVDVPGVFVDRFVINYKSCRPRFVDRDFSRQQLSTSLRFSGVI